MISNRRRQEAGMVTSEYAVGTIGSCGVAGALVTLASSDWAQGFIQGFFDKVSGLLPF